MTHLYSARWVLPISSPAIADGAIAIDGTQIVSVGDRKLLVAQFPTATICDLGNSGIIPGLINAHSHLELTAMRGFLENEETNFFAWLKKLTKARLERMNSDDLYVSAAWGACEAARAGVTSLGDASDAGTQSMSALRDVGLRGVVFQESFGPDAKLARENFEELKSKVERLQEQETPLVKCGVSPHASYTVAGPQLEMISRFAIDEGLPLMMHAAETGMEVALIRDGQGAFADGLRERGIEWQAPGTSPIQYLKDHGVLETHPLLAHCIHVDDADLETLKDKGAKIAHCPKSNAKLGHGTAPFADMVKWEIGVGLGSDSVASNNTCDLLEESRFALLMSRSRTGGKRLLPADVLRVATMGGAQALNLSGQVGELRAGLQADLTVVSLDESHQIPGDDPETTLIFSSSARDVTLTVVAGKEVYRDGRVTDVDEDRLRQRVREVAEKIRGQQ